MKTTCLACGDDIPKERLEAVQARSTLIYCVKCAESRVKYKEADILKSSSTGRNGFSVND
jgi:RNA polymerase-binding transcription factor DksA